MFLPEKRCEQGRIDLSPEGGVHSAVNGVNAGSLRRCVRDPAIILAQAESESIPIFARRSF